MAASDFLVASQQALALVPCSFGGLGRTDVPRLDIELDSVQARTLHA
jgi:hypothetical protein